MTNRKENPYVKKRATASLPNAEAYFKVEVTENTTQVSEAKHGKRGHGPCSAQGRSRGEDTKPGQGGLPDAQRWGRCPGVWEDSSLGSDLAPHTK